MGKFDDLGDPRDDPNWPNLGPDAQEFILELDEALKDPGSLRGELMALRVIDLMVDAPGAFDAAYKEGDLEKAVELMEAYAKKKLPELIERKRLR